MARSPWFWMMTSDTNLRLMGQLGLLGEDAKHDANEIAFIMGISGVIAIMLLAVASLVNMLLEACCRVTLFQLLFG